MKEGYDESIDAKKNKQTNKQTYVSLLNNKIAHLPESAAISGLKHRLKTLESYEARQKLGQSCMFLFPDFVALSRDAQNKIDVNFHLSN